MGICRASTSGFSKKIKLFSGPSTRRWPRFDIDSVPELNSICFGSGSEMQISNISRGGALLKTRERLMPGAKIQFRFFVSGDEIRLAGFVLRSALAIPRILPRYQTAVVFDRPFHMPEDPHAPRACASQILWFESSSIAGLPPVIADPASIHSKEQSDALSATIVSYSVYDTTPRMLCEMLRINSW